MIVTLTLNPSLDRTLTLQTLRLGEVLRATGARIDPGGKGVNVTRVLRAFDVGSHAVIPCAGPDGEELVRLLSKAGVPVTEVPVGGWTRSNITLVEADGRATKVNAPGGALTGQEVALLAETVLDRCLSQSADISGRTRASWAVLSGSLPPGVPDTVYAELTALFAEHGVRVAVDTSGAALLATLDAGPDLIKPNRQELAAAVGTPLNSIADVVAAADKLLSRGVKTVLASLGADGAVLVDSAGAVLGTADPIEPQSTVGAGDALLAGFLAAGASGADALVEGMAWARAAVGLPGSQMPDPSDVSREGIRVVRDPGGKPVGAVHLADNG
ncbi:1-phosphofructokinase family hexose kinase [Catenulispora pinisilvae]|uniref:1-phosphofructokinase family hexose kinase n=1 Tax=Catenulispora pinisilvae TaxID=2705253 RepID=UPI001890CC93|nr:1-phosphofructokinase family hexose kinase [Catenulispora pinisilvae]